MLAAVAAGETIDLSDMPPPPQLPDSGAAETAVPEDGKQESETQQSTATEPGGSGKNIVLRSEAIHRRSSDL